MRGGFTWRRREREQGQFTRQQRDRESETEQPNGNAAEDGVSVSKHSQRNGAAPFFLLLLHLLELLQVLLGHLDDVAGLLLRGDEGGGEGGGAGVERGAGRRPGQALPQALVHGLALQKLRPGRCAKSRFRRLKNRVLYARAEAIYRINCD